MPSSLRLDILRDLRERAGQSQVKMAEICGLHGKQSYQTAGAWERGDMTPNRTRRTKFIGYLWDHLGLRQDPAAFERVWKILEEEWQWEPITDQEWSNFTHQPRSEAPYALHHALEHVRNHSSASVATLQNRQTSLQPSEHTLTISSERLRSEEVQNGLMMWLLAHLAIFATDKTVWCEVRLYTPDSK